MRTANCCGALGSSARAKKWVGAKSCQIGMALVVPAIPLAADMSARRTDLQGHASLAQPPAEPLEGCECRLRTEKEWRGWTASDSNRQQALMRRASCTQSECTE